MTAPSLTAQAAAHAAYHDLPRDYPVAWYDARWRFPQATSVLVPVTYDDEPEWPAIRPGRSDVFRDAPRMRAHPGTVNPGPNEYVLRLAATDWDRWAARHPAVHPAPYAEVTDEHQGGRWRLQLTGWDPVHGPQIEATPQQCTFQLPIDPAPYAESEPLILARYPAEWATGTPAPPGARRRTIPIDTRSAERPTATPGRAVR